jgi:hypothetical protein
MNSLVEPTAVVKPMPASLRQWLEARGFTVDQRTGQATRVVKHSLAYIFGAQDAAQRLLCVPEMLYTHIEDKRDYCRGYESVAGSTLTTGYFLGGAA